MWGAPEALALSAGAGRRQHPLRNVSRVFQTEAGSLMDRGSDSSMPRRPLKLTRG